VLAPAGTPRAIIDRVDWDCEVLKNYSDRNLGVGIRPATGFRWVFEQVEEMRDIYAPKIPLDLPTSKKPSTGQSGLPFRK
jgi:hypothetical protein